MNSEQIAEMREIIQEQTEEAESFDVWYRELLSYLYRMEGFVDQTIKSEGASRPLRIMLASVRGAIEHVECEEKEEPGSAYDHLSDRMYREKERRLYD